MALFGRSCIRGEECSQNQAEFDDFDQMFASGQLQETAGYRDLEGKRVLLPAAVPVSAPARPRPKGRLPRTLPNSPPWLTEEALAGCLAEQNLKFAIQGEGLAVSALFLASRAISGQRLIVDGGRV